MRKISLGVLALALTTGVVSAFASAPKTGNSLQTQFRYTSGGVSTAFTGTPAQASQNFECSSGLNLCASAYTTGTNHTAVPGQNLKKSN